MDWRFGGCIGVEGDAEGANLASPRGRKKQTIFCSLKIRSLTSSGGRIPVYFFLLFCHYLHKAVNVKKR